jgi:uncharacterized protein (DUF924 family)
LSTEIIQSIIDFWLADSVIGPDEAMARREYWYTGGPHVDDAIESDFGQLICAAIDGDLGDWEDSSSGALALVILLDQFTRNTRRGTPGAYSGDEHALGVVTRAITRDGHRELSPPARIFLYHPFHHSERLEDQDRSIALVDAIRLDAEARWHAYIDRSVAGFTRHRDIVARFGRFPHRNRVLGRSNTPVEHQFLASDADHFGQKTTAAAADSK